MTMVDSGCCMLCRQLVSFMYASQVQLTGEQRQAVLIQSALLGDGEQQSAFQALT